MGVAARQTLVEEAGASTADPYSRWVFAGRGKGSVSLPFGDQAKAPFRLLTNDLGFRLVVSTTRVSPSHQPIESPIQGCIGRGRWAGRGSPLAARRMMRTSWFISTRMATWSGVW